ncbi:MAG TPA: UvrD-helicase domain-containing protein, partial [Tepidisphaeraceae bacterium]|nr:UvrD-helicase domain-containing protein [Tepidisphaeraceae bacterium]
MVQGSVTQIPTDFPKYKSYLKDLGQEVAQWGVCADSGYDALAEQVRNFKPPRLPSHSEMPGKAEAKTIVDQVRTAIEQFQKTLAFSSDQWRRGLKEIHPHAATLLSLVDEFAARYQQQKRQIGGLDFPDQERFALRLLQIPEIASACHAQFKHVLVDEYQDINAVQEAILSAVSQTNNLFCVGDVKQSIYRFRLAEPGKFLSKSKSFRDGDGGRVIDLTYNFRSRAGLLATINGVFKSVMTETAAEIDYDDSHHLNPGADFPDPIETGFTGCPIEVHLLEKQGRAQVTDDELDRTQREASLIARRIHQMMGHDDHPRMNVCVRDGEEWKYRPIELSDIVILLRAPAHKADRIADVLREHGIHVTSDRGGGFFDSIEIQDILSLLSLLDNQQQDVPLAAVLRSPIGSFDAESLARIRLAFPEDSFHRAAKLYAEKRSDELGGRLTKFFARLSEWRQLAQRRPLAEVVWTIYSQTGYLTFCAGLVDGEQRQANLLHFHQRCKQFGQFGHGLYRFLRFVDQLRQQQDTDRPPLVNVENQSVRIMSIHAAKGLEFPVV